jgi:hypothetical protein
MLKITDENINSVPPSSLFSRAELFYSHCIKTFLIHKPEVGQSKRASVPVRLGQGLNSPITIRLYEVKQRGALLSVFEGI